MISWIVNASPLILLGKIDRIGLLENLAPAFIIPEAVSLEILAGPDHDPARIWIDSAAAASRVEPGIPIPSEIAAWDLGAGEAAVLALGAARSASVCVLDDLAARNCAEVFQLPVIGTLGILLKARQAGLIPRLGPEIDRLVASGSLLSSAIIQKALALAGETP